MADLTITAASVIADDGYGYTEGIAGETLAQGKPVYLKAADSRFWLADANVTSAENEALGITLNAASAGQPVRVMTRGTITIGATVATGQTYVVSTNVGMICPYSDLASTNYVTILGVAVSTTKIELGIQSTGIQKA